MWKVSWLYEKVHNIANFGGYAAILKGEQQRKKNYRERGKSSQPPVKSPTL